MRRRLWTIVLLGCGGAPAGSGPLSGPLHATLAVPVPSPSFAALPAATPTPSSTSPQRDEEEEQE